MSANNQTTSKKRKHQQNDRRFTKSASEELPEKPSGRGLALVAAISVIIGYIHMNHVSQLFENDRHFSHLSNLEREMTFRTEMGLYYSYFKTIVEADTLLDGAAELYSNNITEYPLVINTLKRFNLYPELVLGTLYRSLNYMGMLHQDCWTVNRGDNLEPVKSCEGMQDPPNFYISCVWLVAAFTASLVFLLGWYLSDSLLGGLLPVICYFYNHSECTRVMWTPPLRESFAFPICLAQILAVSVTLRNQRPGWKNVMAISTMTTMFMVTWQFAQFMLFTQTCAIFGIYVLGMVPRETLISLMVSQVIGLLNSVMLMFGNEMLFTSWFFSCLCSVLVVTLLLNGPLTSLNFTYFINIPVQLILFLGITVLTKIGITRALNVTDDAHIFDLLKAKFTDFSTFHTLLYTCAVEFDFLGWEMPYKTSLTLLIPSTIVACAAVLWHSYKCFKKHIQDGEQEVLPEEKVDPAALYNLVQMAAYAVMAVLIMRLKLFFTPHMCIMTGLLASPKYITVFRSRELHIAALVGLVAAMSIQGISNIGEQRKIMGEYSNIELEEVIGWVEKNVPKNGVLAGPMPTMANIMLSTRRPIVNHPHYEDTGLRERTKKVYSVFSRRNPAEVHKTLVDLKVEYLVLTKPWCLTTSMNGCAITEAWDKEEPALKENARKPLCPRLFKNTPSPFVKLFQNEEYVILRVTPKILEMKPPKSRNS